ncbi:hypothetical protein GEMRC1_013858 [Eukaryota sp. GEM-RC1]
MSPPSKILPGIENKLEFDRSTLWKSFCATQQLFPDRPCIGRRVPTKTDSVVYSDYQWSTYTETVTKVEQIASAMLFHGLQKGDRIGIMSSSRPEWQLVALACQRQGIVITTLYDNVPGVESQYVITDSGLKVLFLDPLRTSSIASINLPSEVEKVVLFPQQSLTRNV